MPMDPPHRAYRVRLHPAARTDLLRIADGIARRSGRAAAQRRLEAFAEALRGLARTPHKGSLRDGIAPGLRAVPAAGRGVVAFVVDDAAGEVRVIAISYAGSDWIGRVTERS